MEDDDKKKNLEELMALLSASNSRKGDVKKEYKFWSTQPVPQLEDDSIFKLDVGGPIEEDKPIDQIQQHPYPLLQQFVWDDVDLKSNECLDELYTLLNENYVEDDEATFRFDYSKEFLRWALFPPGWRRDWHVGVRVAASGKLVAFISAVPVLLHIREHSQTLPEVNFLCVHKKLRSKRLAPVLIKEITRRVNLTGCFQAVYTAGSYLPRPLVANRYYHRSLNTKKLMDVGFSRLPPKMTMSRAIKLNALPSEPLTPGFRALKKEDLASACRVVNKACTKYQLKIEWSEDDFAHWHLEQERVVYSYVVEDQKTHEITDFVSFYIIPSTIIQSGKHDTLMAAYMWNYAATSTPLEQLIKDALIVANSLKMDVFNALDMRENESFFQPLRFNMGDGVLHYYIYNWKCKPIDQSENALVML